MKPLLEKYLPLDHNTSKSSKLALQRQKDHYSHFILRLAFASTEDLRRRFTRVETMLFRLRLAAESPKERDEFVGSLNLDWEMVSEDEKRELKTELSNSAGYRKGAPDDETWCKVDWERVPDLVESRRVFLRAGKAYVPSKEQASMLISEFTPRLERALEVRTNQPPSPYQQRVIVTEPLLTYGTNSSQHAPYRVWTKTIVLRPYWTTFPRISLHPTPPTKVALATCPPVLRSRRATSTTCPSTSLPACRISTAPSAVMHISSTTAVCSIRCS